MLALPDRQRPLKAPILGLSLAAFAAVRDVKSVLLSPDGRDLAYVVAVTDLKANRVRPSCGSPRRPRYP